MGLFLFYGVISSHPEMFMKYLFDISEAYKLQVDCLKIQSLIQSLIKMISTRKWMIWLGEGEDDNFRR